MYWSEGLVRFHECLYNSMQWEKDKKIFSCVQVNCSEMFYTKTSGPASSLCVHSPLPIQHTHQVVVAALCIIP